MDNQVLGPVIVATREVAVEDALDTGSVALLSVDRSTGDVRNHGIATAEGVLGVAERMVLGRGLREPHVTTIATKVTALERSGDVLLDNDSTTSGVDEPGT